MTLLPIRSERIILRRFKLDDIPDLIEFIAHPSVANEVHQMGTSEADLRDYIAQQNNRKPFEPHQVFDLGIERITDRKLIGIVTTILKHHRKAEIGYGLGIAQRGRGYATEAARALMGACFTELGLHRVQAIASSGNPPSVRVLERLGMKLEGRLREANLRDGNWCDLLYFGLLENEWRSKQG